MRKEFCSDEVDAVHLLNRMLRRGLMHHCSLNKLMENNATAFYRFPQDHFKVRSLDRPVTFTIRTHASSGWIRSGYRENHRFRGGGRREGGCPPHRFEPR